MLAVKLWFPQGDAVMIRTLLGLALLVAFVGLTACETTEGAGRDIKHAGRSIERAADDAK